MTPLLASHAMSAGSQAVCFFVAFVAFLVAAIVAWVVSPRILWAVLVAFGLAAFVFVFFWNALAAS